jgi:uncharacterized protein YyaL (SSP411 family)
MRNVILVKTYTAALWVVGFLLLSSQYPINAQEHVWDVWDVWDVWGAGGSVSGEEEVMAVNTRLSQAKSPYLIEHADNTVAWYPWGEEALAKARDEDIPIFLSIGYSACHWCHVMEEESFMDPEVGELLNGSFVSILVDREERPDIDKLYGVAAELISGRRGWPQTIFLTPVLKPIYATSYLPKVSRFGQPGLVDTVRLIDNMWKTRRDYLLSTADKVESALKTIAADRGGEQLHGDLVSQTYEQLKESFDGKNSGFGDAPKFPVPHKLMFLLQYHKRTGDSSALQMVENALVAMRRGGIYDQLGFGFHRYSTDALWRLPHFEKMLYDQALLAIAYIEAYQVTEREEFAKTAREILTYVLRDMTAKTGGFFSSEDADSEGEEGRFYLWEWNELKEVLRDEELGVLALVYELEESGNFVDPVAGKKTGMNVLHRGRTMDEIAEELGVEAVQLEEGLGEIRKKLFDVRENREHPSRDDKILADWNGLMIAAFAKAARAFDDELYRKTAESAASFILSEMVDDRGNLLHRYRDGDAAIRGFADDYAYMVWGLLELYETTFQVQYIKDALALQKRMIDLFWDDVGGGFYFSAQDGEQLMVRQKEHHDGALPSGNSVAMYNLLKIGRLTAEPQYEEYAVRVGMPVSDAVKQHQVSYVHLMSALDFANGPSFELVIAGDTTASDTRSMIRAVHQRYLPHKVLLLRPTEEQEPEVVKLASFTRYHESLNGRAAAYVCENFSCKTPTSDIELMLDWLNGE